MTIRLRLLGAASGAAQLASPAYAACTGTRAVTCTGTTTASPQFGTGDETGRRPCRRGGFHPRHGLFPNSRLYPAPACDS